jgi:hypothetical protein
MDANARLMASLAASFTLGPLLAGLVSHRWGAASAVMFDGVSFLVSAGALALTRAVAAPRLERATSDVTLVDALRFIWNDPLLRVGVALLATLTGLGAATLQLLIFHLKVDLACDEARIGSIFALASVGAIAGAAAAPATRRRLGLGRAIWLGSAVDAFFTIGVGLAASATGIAVAATGWAFGSRIRDVALISMRQERVPDHLLGRVSAAYWALMTLAAPLGAAIAGAAAERVGVGRVLVASGALASVAVVLVARSALGRAR